MLTKPRFQLTRNHLETLRNLVMNLNRTNELTADPGRFVLAFDNNFGVGKYHETALDLNAWIGYRQSQEGDRKLHLVHWFEWLLTNYVTTFTPPLAVKYIHAVIFEGNHPIEALQLLKSEKSAVNV